ncbi:DUF4352 domain-containing protein [Streptomyces endophyticus]|uniref:DUF4352 domain-containing protein n=1 Tax=Streptomyces endophyticus TaxID=714166 RepID=A0ABU6FFB9_9ACTN|nr:DUF4352 domain-containing protein [Streptomyces endophyticus]MEB8342332.1 DUF4352 domain-containing protein [Streptomyces endophyticus]
MGTYVRRAVLLAVPAVLVTVLTGCSSADSDKAEAAPSTTVEASASFDKVDVGEPTEEPQAAPAPMLAVGTNGPFDVYDDTGETVKTQMNVKVESAKYVTATDLDTSNRPENGQYVVLKLTLKNVGKAPGNFAAYGAMKWQDTKTAPQDCTTLEVADGPELDTEYGPGQGVTGSVVLDVPRKGGTVTYYDGPGKGAFAVLLPKS